MSIIPTKLLTTAYDKFTNQGLESIEFGSKKQYKLKYEYNKYTDTQTTTFIHYGTKVLEIITDKYGTIEYNIIGGYSNTDRDYINGLLKLNKITEIKCRKIKDNLGFVMNVTGKIERYSKAFFLFKDGTIHQIKER